MPIRSGAAVATEDDVALMRRMHEHDDAAAFAELYARHSSSVMGVAYLLLRDRAAAEDVTQEAFLSLWRARTSYRSERSAPRTWLLTIARNRAIDAIRRRPAIADAPLGEDHLEHEAPERTEELVLRQAEASVVRAQLKQLPDAQRNVLELSFYAGLTQTELAERLSLPLGTVKGRMRLGMRRLAKQLEAPGTVRT